RIESQGNSAADFQSAMPDRRDFAQVEFAGFGNQTQLFGAWLILRDQAHFGGKFVGIETKWPSTLLLDGGGYGIDALIVVAPGDDEDRHVLILWRHCNSAPAMASEIGNSNSRSSIPHSPPGLTSRNTCSPWGVRIRSIAPYTRPRLVIRA